MNATRKALAAIERRGALLVYPVENRAEPPSLWRELYPRSPMRWAWDQDADPRVVALWHLREQLARSREVVYSKWWRGRAMFFSQPVFEALLADLRAHDRLIADLSPEARTILDLLEEDSPISTKELRKRADLQGRWLERPWTRAMTELFARGLIVGTGEVDDATSGAFPPLAVGATRWIFEDLWVAAGEGPTDAGRALLARALPPSSAFGKHWAKVLERLR
ncbi:MAG: hypothetical protein HYV09_23240 [Deltaproteobacteria bacterium]|nr:hypothetical protein [Deltaproteobacteria bacterium]